MITLSEGAVAVLPARPERAAEVMRSVSGTGRSALAEVRKMLGVLREDAGDRAGQPLGGHLEPVPGLGQLIEQVRLAGLEADLEVAGPVPEVPGAMRLTVYRLVQEALTNTLKHAGRGARVRVRLWFTPGKPGKLHVDVADDGAGLVLAVPAGAGAPPGQGSFPGGGGGLTGMRERVRASGGEVLAGPDESGGWRVSAWLNLDDA
jgi:signal transduction histidine kinase